MATNCEQENCSVNSYQGQSRVFDDEVICIPQLQPVVTKGVSWQQDRVEYRVVMSCMRVILHETNLLVYPVKPKIDIKSIIEVDVQK